VTLTEVIALSNHIQRLIIQNKLSRWAWRHGSQAIQQWHLGTPRVEDRTTQQREVSYLTRMTMMTDKTKAVMPIMQRQK
jgi:hypothetical protein